MVSLLAGCGTKEVDVAPEKKILQIRTQSIHNADNTGYISKSAKVQWSSDITITSQVAGRVQWFAHQIGDKVNKNALLVSLQDTNNTANGVQSAELGLARAKFTDTISRDDIAKQKEKLSYDLNNVDGSVDGSTTQIQLSKLQKDLEKAEFDYQSKLKSDDQTNENLITSAKNIQGDLEIILNDTATETDKLLGITDTYINGDYKDLRVYLWVRDNAVLNEVKNNFYTISSLQKQLDVLTVEELNADNVTEYLKTYQSIVSSLSSHFVLMKKLFIKSIEDARYATQLATVQWTFTALQTKNSAINASITSQLNALRSYFVSYKDNQESLLRQIESLRSQIELTKKWLKDASFNTTIASDRSEIWFNTQLQNNSFSIDSASLSLQQAYFNQSKFRISAPIAASIADIFVDIGQDVAPGTPLMRIVSPQQQIEVNLTIDEVKNITVGQKVDIKSDVGFAEWLVSNISQIADKTGSFKVLILLNKSTIPTGVSVDLQLPIQQWTIVLPINSLSIVDSNTAIINVWDENLQDVVVKTVTIQAIFGDQVEIADALDMNYSLILTDLSNYDSRTMQIELLK